MKLEIDQAEVERILLEWAEAKFPKLFNEVDVDTSYSMIRKVTFFRKEIEVTE